MLIRMSLDHTLIEHGTFGSALVVGMVAKKRCSGSRRYIRRRD
jgi:hypothetical protein